ncbi:hypothetical protein J6590_092784 [Homalodisca vitripennis]|nr:hypothetical protein J6590_092784 [Homalodisca vitripennis]
MRELKSKARQACYTLHSPWTRVVTWSEIELDRCRLCCSPLDWVPARAPPPSTAANLQTANSPPPPTVRLYCIDFHLVTAIYEESAGGVVSHSTARFHDSLDSKRYITSIACVNWSVCKLQGRDDHHLQTWGAATFCLVIGTPPQDSLQRYATSSCSIPLSRTRGGRIAVYATLCLLLYSIPAVLLDRVGVSVDVKTNNASFRSYGCQPRHTVLLS